MVTEFVGDEFAPGGLPAEKAPGDFCLWQPKIGEYLSLA